MFFVSYYSHWILEAKDLCCMELLCYYQTAEWEARAVHVSKSGKQCLKLVRDKYNFFLFHGFPWALIKYSIFKHFLLQNHFLLCIKIFRLWMQQTAILNSNDYFWNSRELGHTQSVIDTGKIEIFFH